MQRVLGRLAPYLYAMLRIAAGAMVAIHGAQTLFGVMGGRQAPLLSLMSLAGGIELVAGLLIAAGLFTSLAALIASGEMAAVYVMQHAPRGQNPVVNGGELAVLYCWIFLYFAATGPGAWALDNLLWRRAARTN
jgi:putative oxidoreductase